uniref:Protein 4.1 n=1 Tax=Sus scrofa TaxID=9823 RepID=A0A8D2BGI4_PIG
GSGYSCDLEKRAKGQVLFDKVCEHLNLLEKDYFGLVFQENPEQKNWVDPAKEIKRQLRNLPWLFTFNVKFYPPDPSQLTEDITRYFLCLQLRQDIASGRLPCSLMTHALLGSYTLQAELGDYDPEEHDSNDLSDFQFAPTQTKELEEKVAELYKTHRGLSPAQADSQFLENAKRLSMYGVDLHHAKDSEGVDIKLGVCANGLLIYKDRLRINRFAWPKILKISYKRSNFYIKVRPAELEQFESTIGFKLPNHRAAKRLWKVCVEHHTFYRLVSPEPPPKAKFLTLGSKFRYSGRTQAQTRQASTLIDRPAPHFERTSSKRVSRSLDGAPVGVVDQSLMKDFAGPAGEVSAYGLGVVSPAVVQDGDGRRDVRSLAKAPPVQYIEGKSKGDRLFKDIFSMKEKHQMAATRTVEEKAQEADKKRAPESEGPCAGASDAVKSSHETLNVVEEKKQAEVGKDERVITEEVNGKALAPGRGPGEMRKVEPGTQKDSTSLSSESSPSSESEDEDVGEYRPHHQVTEGTIREEQEEEEEVEEAPGPAAKVVEREDPVPAARPVTHAGASVSTVETVIQENIVAPQIPTEKSVNEGVKQDVREDPEDEPQKVNGEVSHVDIDVLPQVICCSEPPVVKTEMVTISDASQRTEISTKEVPIVQTETKTITYESPQIDGGAGGDSGTLLTAQTITSESVSTTTTTHITKTVKGGISETRIEKRIVITGDADIDHDQALAQAIREAREQHPDMSVTRVVVHKETELEEGDE